MLEIAGGVVIGGGVLVVLGALAEWAAADRIPRGRRYSTGPALPPPTEAQMAEARAAKYEAFLRSDFVGGRDP